MKLQRIYHHYKYWGDYHNGLYKLEKQDHLVNKAKECLGDEKLCYKRMKYVADNWTFASEVNLTNNGTNRRSRLGQAACCAYCGISEDNTIKARCMLTRDQMRKANKISDDILLYRQTKQLQSYSLFKTI